MEPRSFGEFNYRTMSLRLHGSGVGGETHNRGSSQNPTPLGRQCTDCDGRLCFWVADLVAFINNDPLPPNVQQG